MGSSLPVRRAPRTLAPCVRRGGVRRGGLVGSGLRFATWKTDPPWRTDDAGVASGAPGWVPESVGRMGAPSISGESAATPLAVTAGRFTDFAVTSLRVAP